MQAEALAEPLVVGLGHAEQVGDDEHGERLRVGADELAATVGDELVELLIGETPHELLVLLAAASGVRSRISSARSRVCSGGSMVTMCSFIGSWSR